MSTTSSTPEQWRCNECGDRHPSHEFFNAAMCSPECEARDQVSSFLNTLKYDHRFCYTCFRRLKTIMHPEPSHPESFIGYQFRTQYASPGEKSPAKHDAESFTRYPSADRQLYAYEIHDDEQGEIREYHPARGLDYRNSLEYDYSLKEDMVYGGTVCDGCGSTSHTDLDENLRELHPIMTTHFLTKRLRELDTDFSVHEDTLWDHVCEGISVEDALLKATEV